MKDGHTTKSESSFGKKLWCVLIVLLLGGIGWQMWKLNAYNNAVREAKEAGFEWTCVDTISLFRQDWRNVLKKETWGAHLRKLNMGEVPDLGRCREMLHCLRPTVLYAEGCENVDVLKGLTGLRELYLPGCPALQSLDAIKGLSGLKMLDLWDCRLMKNADALKAIIGLQTLNLSDCRALQNIDGLKNLADLQTLYLQGCTALQNVDGIKGLTGLKELNLYNCNKIPAAALRELRAALPKTDITFPDGGKSPP